MTEINNNISNLGPKIDKIDSKKPKINSSNENINKGEEKVAEYVQDTGVLGRSLVKPKNDISASVNKAVELAEKNPVVLIGCDSVFNSFYESFLQEGCSAEEAYMKALFAEEELLGITQLNR